jgi:hypothetical protein
LDKLTKVKYEEFWKLLFLSWSAINCFIVNYFLWAVYLTFRLFEERKEIIEMIGNVEESGANSIDPENSKSVIETVII